MEYVQPFRFYTPGNQPMGRKFKNHLAAAPHRLAVNKAVAQWLNRYSV
ncbi:MAG: hypothetical protein ACI4UV_07505 [Victivallales bacterium]